MRRKHTLMGFFAHAGIIVGMMFVVFFVIDRFNPAMEFLTSSLSKWLILLLALCAVVNGGFSAVQLFRREKRREERRQAGAAADARVRAEAVKKRAMREYDDPRGSVRHTPPDAAQYDRESAANYGRSW